MDERYITFPVIKVQLFLPERNILGDKPVGTVKARYFFDESSEDTLCCMTLFAWCFLIPNQPLIDR